MCGHAYLVKRYHFVQADVFTDRPFFGNQLAVFTDARGLSDDEMQALAREMNYAESTFVLPPELPGCAKRVRIFTPAREMAMAGHPTVGTTWVLAQRGELPAPGPSRAVTLQLGIGPVDVVVETEGPDAGFVWMSHRAPTFGPPRDVREPLARALNLEPDDIRADLPIQVVSTGTPFLLVPLRSLDAAGRIRPNDAALRPLLVDGENTVGCYTFTMETTAPGMDAHVRMFAPRWGIFEDPATGSGAAPLGCYVAQHGLLSQQPHTRLAIEQGMEMGRPSIIHVEVGTVDDHWGSLRIGGKTVIVGEGEIFWP